MADVNSTFKVYITNEPVFKVYVNNGAKGDTGEGVPAGGVANQYLVKLSGDDYDTVWQTIDSTQVAYGDGTVSEGLDNRYTKGETDLLLDDKSDVGHTHDDRYFTETEVGVLLSGKSDTTHNHDLTYAPIVHNHDDIYYTDDEVDTLLLSKSDTTHTHDLIKNATEANAKIEASSTGVVITRNVPDSNVPLSIDGRQSVGRLLNILVNGSTKAYVYSDGYIFGANGFGSTVGLRNESSVNYARINPSDSGTIISRNVADANTALMVNQANAGSTGNIAEFQFAGTTQASITKFGQLKAPILLASGGLAYTSSTDYAYFHTPVTGPVISRNISDANPALKVNQQNASSTGNIAEFQFNGTTKLAIDKNGLVPATNIANTPSGNISATTVQGAINELDNEKADKLYATNLVTNGDFSNGTTGWTAVSSSLSAVGNVLSVTANGTANYGMVYHTTSTPSAVGKKVYLLATVRATNANCNYIELAVDGATAGTDQYVQITTPVQNQWYVKSMVASQPADVSGNIRLKFLHAYADAATANGKVIEIKYVQAIDLTAIFGAGKEPSAIQMDNMLSTFTNSWFNGTNELFDLKKLFELASSDSLIATYKHTANKEVVVSAFDPGTDTFTSVGHGLSNNNTVNPIINSNLGNVFPALYYPGGMGFVTAYYVVNATSDTFQLSLTSGGPPVNFTENPNIDLTKWHFEQRNGVLTISNLPPSYKYRVVIRGKFCQNQSLYILPNSIQIAQEWFTQNGAFTYSAISVGDVSFYADILIDYTSELVEVVTSGSVETSTSIANIWSGVSNKVYISPKYKATHITSISVQQAVLANGSTVEVYKV